MNKEFEKFANRVMLKYQKKMLLQACNIYISYSPVMEDGIYMSCSFAYPYKESNIKYGESALTLWSEKKKVELERVIIHEMCHIVTDELYSKGYDRFITKTELEDARERTTDHFANMIYSLAK
jgi:hypothetical protein